MRTATILFVLLFPIHTVLSNQEPNWSEGFEDFSAHPNVLNFSTDEEDGFGQGYKSGVSDGLPGTTLQGDGCAWSSRNGTGDPDVYSANTTHIRKIFDLSGDWQDVYLYYAYKMDSDDGDDLEIYVSASSTQPATPEQSHGGRTSWDSDVVDLTDHIGDSSVYVWFQFTPQHAGSGMGALLDSINLIGAPIGGSEPEINVQGNGQTIANGDIQPTTSDHTDFEGVDYTSGSRTYTFTIQNTGTAALDLTGNPKVSLSGDTSEFSVTAQPASPVNAGNSTTFNVMFNPTSAGIKDATVSISNTDSNEDPYTFAIKGEGIGPASEPEMDVQGNDITIPDGDTSPASADNTDYDLVMLGTSKTNVFAVFNLGTANLNLTGTPQVQISSTHATDFSVINQPSTPILPGNSDTFKLRFTPGGSGDRTATVTISNNDNNEDPYTFTVHGTGSGAPEIEIRGSNQLIPDGQVGGTLSNHTDFEGVDYTSGSRTYTYTITNAGSATLNLSGSPLVQITGGDAVDFSVSLQPSASIPAAASTTFSIIFDPSSVGIKQTTVTISNNDSDENPYNFAIRGEGNPPATAPEIELRGNTIPIPDGDSSPGSADGTDFDAVAISSSKTNMFAVHNLGTANLDLTGTPKVQVSGTHASDFVVLSQPFSPIAPGANDTFKLRFSPGGSGDRTATISISNNDGDENPYTFDVHGAGASPELEIRGNTIHIPDGDVTAGTADGTSFDGVIVGSGKTNAFVIHNLGTASLNLTGTPRVLITGSADFTLVNIPSTPIGGGASDVFKIAYRPTGLGLRTATASIANDDADENPYTFTIAAEGQSNGHDDDLDGMPNWWESLYFPGPTQAIATIDSDVDGFNNMEEYIAATMPTAATSRFQAVNISNGTARMIGVPSATGRIYSLFRNTNILGTVWTPVITNSLGTGNHLSISDTNSLPAAHYRLGVRLQ